MTAINPSLANVAQAYQRTEASFTPADQRGAAAASAPDAYANLGDKLLKAREIAPASSSASVVVELSSIKRDAIAMMNALPVEVRVEMADKVRAAVQAGDWPTDRDASNAAIKDMIQKQLSFANG